MASAAIGCRSSGRLRRRWVDNAAWRQLRWAGRIAPASQAGTARDARDGQDLLLHRLTGAGDLIQRPDGLRADSDPGELARRIVRAHCGEHRTTGGGPEGELHRRKHHRRAGLGRAAISAARELAQAVDDCCDRPPGRIGDRDGGAGLAAAGAGTIVEHRVTVTTLASAGIRPGTWAASPTPAQPRRLPGPRTGTPDGAGRAWLPRGGDVHHGLETALPAVGFRRLPNRYPLTAPSHGHRAGLRPDGCAELANIRGHFSDLAPI